MMDGEERSDRPLLVVQYNSDGRPCLWARAALLADAKAWCEEHWATHGGSGCGCYPGEQKGDLVITDLDSGLVIDRIVGAHSAHWTPT